MWGDAFAFSLLMSLLRADPTVPNALMADPPDGDAAPGIPDVF